MCDGPRFRAILERNLLFVPIGISSNARTGGISGARLRRRWLILRRAFHLLRSGRHRSPPVRLPVIHSRITLKQEGFWDCAEGRWGG